MNKIVLTLLASAALCASLPLRANAELDVAALKGAIEKSVEADYPKLDALYKDIHAHPEIAFQEEKTAAKLAAEMRALGFDVTEHVGKTGLVAIYRNGELGGRGQDAGRPERPVARHADVHRPAG